jgi:hypothetical protein
MTKRLPNYNFPKIRFCRRGHALLGDTAQQAMNVFCRKLAPLARLIEAAPAETTQGLRAKALAAMYECIPGIGDHSGFDFEDGPPAYEMLFRACLGVTGLSKLATEIESGLRLEVQP